MKQHSLCLRTLTFVSLVGAASAAAGCSDAEDTVPPGVGDSGTVSPEDGDDDTVSEGTVPQPDFGFSTSNHTLLTDENGVVTTSSGYIQLILHIHSAQTYAVVQGVLSKEMSPDDLARQMKSARRSGALSSPYLIQAADLDLAGVDLTNGASRSIILRNTDQGKSAYQVLRLDFTASGRWTAEEWGTCSAICGGGTQTRALKCELNGAVIDSSRCLDTPPATSQACNEDPCGSWVSDAWGTCSATCGGGTQTRVNRCQVNGADVDPSYCLDAAPATSQACNEDPCGDDSDLGALVASGTCGVLGVQGPGFLLTAGPTQPLPVGTTITVTGSGVADIGQFSVTGGTATVTELSGTSRQIVLTAPLAAGAQMAFLTTLSISVAFTLNAAVSLPEGYVATGGKTTGSVTSTLILCSGT
ncbi:MAG: hypothetical protein K0S65_2825 [Labilithrix sp.]|nr:hypothetical protein [Labilithrix sp.]